MRVLIHQSHHDPNRPDGWSGAPGEATWVLDLVSRIQTALTARGIVSVITPGDLKDHPEFHADYDAFIAPHYEANVHNEGGSFWGRASASATPEKDDRLGAIFWQRYSLLPGKPQNRFQWNNVNVTDYYAFRQTTPNTPGILVEHGVGAPGAPDFQWLRDNVQAIANVWVSALAAFLGTQPPGPQTVPARFWIIGPARQFSAPPTAHPDAAEWAAIYASAAPNAGIRAEAAFAQALKETANFNFGGTAQREWNNPAGLGVTGAPGIGNRFPTKLAGAQAHLGHLLCYIGVHTQPFCTLDQRHFSPGQTLWTGVKQRTASATGHMNLPNDLRELDGRWAVPGTGYGESVASIAESLPFPQPAPVLTLEQKVDRLLAIAEARESMVWIARDQRSLDVERGDTFDPNRPPLDPRIDKR